MQVIQEIENVQVTLFYMQCPSPVARTVLDEIPFLHFIPLPSPSHPFVLGVNIFTAKS